MEVINAVDPIRRYPECPLGIASHRKRLCPLHRRLDDATQMEDAFRVTMLVDLLAALASRRRLVAFPRNPAENRDLSRLRRRMLASQPAMENLSRGLWDQ